MNWHQRKKIDYVNFLIGQIHFLDRDCTQEDVEKFLAHIREVQSAAGEIRYLEDDLREELERLRGLQRDPTPENP